MKLFREITYEDDTHYTLNLTNELLERHME